MDWLFGWVFDVLIVWLLDWWRISGNNAFELLKKSSGVSGLGYPWVS
jgi:hypothetical protein